MSTTIQRQTIELLTPALLAGAHQHQPEWRGASLHGQLHFWARVLFYSDGDSAAMRRGEARLTGGLLKQDGKQVPWAAPFAVWLDGEVERSPKEYPNCPHNRSKGRRNGIAPGKKADLCWSLRHSGAWDDADPAANQKLEDDFGRLLRTWILLGALGLRANRAAGSVWIPGPPPTPKQFQQWIEGFGLPTCIEVRLLPVVAATDLEGWVNRLRRTERDYLFQHGVAEQLRAIATDTVGGSKDCIQDNPLGYAGNGAERKASPLKLKVGRFADGLRLIAVHDDRHGRGGCLNDAIDELVRQGKFLGELLRQTASMEAPEKAVKRLLAPPFKLSDFERYHGQVQTWLEAGQLQTVAEFIRATQGASYSVMREKAWYRVAQNAAKRIGSPLP